MLGIWSTFMMISFPFDLLFFTQFLLNKRKKKKETSEETTGEDPVAIDNLKLQSENEKRRIFLKQSIFLSSLGASSLFNVFGYFQSLKGPQLKTVEIPLKKNSLALQKLTFVQISDLHIGIHIKEDYVENVVSQTNRLLPDFIFLTGDIVDAALPLVKSSVQLLGKLKAHFGVYYVTGNHEYYSGIEPILEELKSLGIIVLLNENRVIQVEGEKILIAGVTDDKGGQFIKEHAPDFKRASFTTESNIALKIMLAHRPNACLKIVEEGFDIQLSGHTHAGQYFPFNLFVGLAHHFSKGLNREGSLWVYVNAATGYWGPQNRFLVPSEITQIKIT